MLEAEIEKKVCGYAKKIGMLCYKFTSPAKRAVPDRLFVCPNGRIFFIEFKAPGKKPTPLQLHEHQKLRSSNAVVLVVDDVAEGKAHILDQMGRDLL